ncbi:hypothetical protein ACIBG5_10775 [Kribbella sp. NPDC050241]|uniref:hypothetical protein n=1 Tax=Kribbella sp. NPDC050241 TaxID=3364115 RepID=UPI0037A4397C
MLGRILNAGRHGTAFDAPVLNQPGRWLLRAVLMGAWCVSLGSAASLVLFSMTVGWFLPVGAIDAIGQLLAICGFAVVLVGIATWFLGMFKLHKPTPLAARATDKIGRPR